MSEPIKLKLAGEKHTLDVARCRLLPFGNDPEIEYEGRDGSKVWVPQASSDRQLARLNLTMESVVGRRVTIKRDANSVKGRPPFWGIYLEDANGTGGAQSAPRQAGATSAAKETSQTVTAPSAPAPSGHEEKASTLYARVTAYVLGTIAPMYAKAGIPMSDQGVARCVNTLFINANGRH